jgi:hypothetical protein
MLSFFSCFWQFDGICDRSRIALVPTCGIFEGYEHLATFIVALKQILFDIRFFCVVFMILIFCFGDMVHLVFVLDDNIDCTQPEDESAAAEDFCSPFLVDSYIRVYGGIIGDIALR